MLLSYLERQLNKHVGRASMHGAIRRNRGKQWKTDPISLTRARKRSQADQVMQASWLLACSQPVGGHREFATLWCRTTENVATQRSRPYEPKPSHDTFVDGLGHTGSKPESCTQGSVSACSHSVGGRHRGGMVLNKGNATELTAHTDLTRVGKRLHTDYY